MPRRILAVAGALVAVIAIGWLLTTTAATQTPDTKTSSGTSTTVPRTPWGDPDLQGVWAPPPSSSVPLERPRGRPAQVTEEEARRAEDARLERMDNDTTSQGGVGAYNSVFRSRQAKPATQTALIVDPPDGRIPPLTPEGKARADSAIPLSSGRSEDSPQDRGLWERCITYRGAPMIPAPTYNENVQVVQTPGYIAFLLEMVHETRVIPIGDKPHLPHHIRQWLGDSRGRWEGNTLVVETTNFSDRTSLYGSGSTLTLVERFTRVDADTITYEFTVNDPATFTRPWTASVPWAVSPGLYEYACHEGNYGMVNILKGGRATEQAAAQSKKR